MSTPADQLAAALPALVHPELGPIMLVNFQTFPGQDDEQQDQINTFARTVAEAIEHTLNERGYRIVTETELAQAPKAGSYTQVTMLCEACGTTRTITTMSPQDATIRIPHRGLHPCETCHGTT